jgi:hypothetical protein
VTDETIAALSAMLARTLAVPSMEGQTYSEWLKGRAAAIAQILLLEYGGLCAEHGALPIAVLRPEETTEEIHVTKGP